MSKHLFTFVKAIFKNYWCLVLGTIGGAQSIASVLGYTPHAPWIIGVVILLFGLLIAAFLAYRDLYIHLEVMKQPHASMQPYQKRNIKAKEMGVIFDLQEQMERIHGHSDYDGIEAAAHDGVPWDEIMKQDCTHCGKPRNKKGDYVP